MRINQLKIGPEYRKFNNDLVDYISFIKQVIPDYESNNPAELCNPLIKRHTLKCVIRVYTIQYSAQKRRLKRYIEWYKLSVHKTETIGTKNAIVTKFTQLLFA